MNFRAAIATSALLHVVFLGLAYSVEVDEQVEPDDGVREELVAIEFERLSRLEDFEEEVDEESPASGAGDEEVEPEREPEQSFRSEQTDEPEEVRESEPESSEERDEEPSSPPEEEESQDSEDREDEELEPVVADRDEEADTEAETDEEVDEDASASASTADADEKAGEGDREGGRSGEAKRATGSARNAADNKAGDGRGIDSGELEQRYGRVLHGEIERSKRYPRLARKAGIEGRVVVAVTVDADGRILDVRVEDSSGHDILDRKTVESIRRLERFPDPPSALTWREKTFVLPVNYKLS